MNRNNSTWQQIKKVTKVIKMFPIYMKLVIFLPLILIGFLFLYSIVYIEVIWEPIMCMYEKCDKSETPDSSKPTSITAMLQDEKNNRNGSVQLAAGTKREGNVLLVEAPHQRATLQAITDKEFKTLAERMIKERLKLNKKYAEPVQYYSTVLYRVPVQKGKDKDGKETDKVGDITPQLPDMTDPNTGNMDGDKITKEAYRMFEAHGVNSSNPWRYSQEKRTVQGFADCSMFTYLVYKQAMGIDIGSTTIDQIEKNAKNFHYGRDKLSEVKPGDLMYFDGAGGGGHSRVINGQSISVQHTGIYVGGNKFIDMDQTGSIDGISIRDIGPGGKSENYAKNRFIGYVRIGTPGTGSNYEEGEGKQLDEAELHARALANVDWYALVATDIFVRGKRDEIVMEDGKEKIKDAYKGTMLEKAFLVGKGLEKDDQKSLYRYATNKRTDDWSEKDWMLNAQFIAYNCYLVGNEKEKANNLWEWISSLFDVGPCDKLDEILKKESDGKLTSYVNKDDWGVLSHEHVIKEVTWICKPKPPEEEKTTQAKPASGTQKGELQLVMHRSKTNVSKKDCQYGHTEQVEEKWYADFPRLYSGEQEKSVLKHFEPYSLVVKGKNVSSGSDFLKELADVLRIFYGDKLESNEGLIVYPGGGGGGSGGTDFIIPMEDGTYNFASPFGPRDGTIHKGDDMGTLGVKGVPIYSTSNGVVVSTGWVNGYGYTVMVKHDNGYYSFYAHMQEDFIVVKKDQKVQQAQLVGGVSNVPGVPEHLHFEVCLKEVVSASGNLMCGNHVDAEDDDDSKDKTPDDVKLKFNKSQDMGKSKGAANKFLSEWKDKAKAGEVFIMPGYVGGGGGGNGPRGVLSEEFESQKGECGISRGDLGGLSCGFYQFANNPYGQVCAFVHSLKAQGASQYWNYFGSYCPTAKTVIGNDVAFMNQWNGLFVKNGGQTPADFKDLQWKFAKAQDYDPVVNRLKKTHNIDISTRHIAVQEMIWSMGMQQPGLVPGIFTHAGFNSGTNWASVNDMDLVTRIYDARYDLIPSNFVSSPAMWPGIRKRYIAEKQKALALFGGAQK